MVWSDYEVIFMKILHKSNPLAGFLAGEILLFFGRLQKSRPFRATNLNLSSNTQKMGIGFPEALRNFYRRKWLKLK
jgi:hypothetical protein